MTPAWSSRTCPTCGSRLARCCTWCPATLSSASSRAGTASPCTGATAPTPTRCCPSPRRSSRSRWAPPRAACSSIQAQVEALDRSRHLSDVTRVISDNGVNILSAAVTTSRDRVAKAHFTFEMGDPATSGTSCARCRRSTACSTPTGSPVAAATDAEPAPGPVRSRLGSAALRQPAQQPRHVDVRDVVGLLDREDGTAAAARGGHRGRDRRERLTSTPPIPTNSTVTGRSGEPRAASRARSPAGSRPPARSSLTPSVNRAMVVRLGVVVLHRRRVGHRDGVGWPVSHRAACRVSRARKARLGPLVVGAPSRATGCTWVQSRCPAGGSRTSTGPPSVVGQQWMAPVAARLATSIREPSPAGAGWSIEPEVSITVSSRVGVAMAFHISSAAFARAGVAAALGLGRQPPAMVGLRIGRRAGSGLPQCRLPGIGVERLGERRHGIRRRGTPL